MSRASRRAMRVRKGRPPILKKIILWAIVILIGTGIGGYFWVMNYLSGDGFRGLLEKQTAKALHMERVTIFPLNWTSTSVQSSRVNGMGGGELTDFSVENFYMMFNKGALWNNCIEINEAKLDTIKINMVKRKESKSTYTPSSPTPSPLPQPIKQDESPSRTTVASDMPAERSATDGRQKSWWEEKFAPRTLKLGKVSIRSANVTYTDNKGTYSLNDLNINLIPDLPNQQYKLNLSGGKFTLPYEYLKSGELNTATVTYKNDFVTITNCSLKPGKGGTIYGEGDWDRASQDATASLVINDVACENVVPDDWKQRLNGNLNGTCKISVANGRIKNISGTVTIKDGSLTALPILDTMAAFVNTSAFRQLILTAANAQFDYKNNKLLLHHIELASEGLLLLEGELILDETEHLQGTLRLGLVPGLLSAIPGAEEKVFLAENNAGKKGLLWANINIGGTLDSPTEDLSARLITAAGDRLFDIVPESGRQVLRYSADIATRVLGEVRDQHKEKREKEGKKENTTDKVMDKTIDTLDRASKLLGL